MRLNRALPWLIAATLLASCASSRIDTSRWTIHEPYEGVIVHYPATDAVLLSDTYEPHKMRLRLIRLPLADEAEAMDRDHEMASDDTLPSRDIAERIVADLKNGKAGPKMDSFVLDQSIARVSMAGTAAQASMHLWRKMDSSRLLPDECNVVFEQSAIFEHKGDIYLLHLFADTADIVASMPEYFTTDPYVCGMSLPMWKEGKQADFYATLKKRRGSSIAQQWYDTFQAMLGTVELE